MEPLCPYYEFFLVLITLEIKNHSNHEKQLQLLKCAENSKLHFIIKRCKNPVPCTVTIFCFDEVHLLAYVINLNMPFIK